MNLEINYRHYQMGKETVVLYLNHTTHGIAKSIQNDDVLLAAGKKASLTRAVEMCAPHLSEIGKHRMETCGDWLHMLETEDRSARKLERGFFCGLRFCPACAWRYSLAWGRVLCAVDRALCNQGLVPLMATLTVRNVPAEQLHDTLLHMADAWHKLIRRKEYKRAWAHYARKTEVTYNQQRNDYHPHYHIMVWVDKSYFGGAGGYISQAKLLKDWRDATGMPEITQVDLRRCRDAKQQGAAVAEVAKYVAKSSDYLVSQAAFEGFWGGLHGIRIITLGGAAKRTVAEFRRGALKEYDPIEQTDLDRYTVRAIYHWDGRRYNLTGAEDVDLMAEHAAEQERREMWAQDMAAMQLGYMPADHRIYHKGGGASYMPVKSPWDEVQP